ncbi:MAG: HEAT repeat domain-containing protein [Deltaproteobacteria bacterium]|nr:HEAT repeat domain-containing protein [Deltaproteobacteria bacterium]
MKAPFALAILLVSTAAEAHPRRLLDSLASIDVIPTKEQLVIAGGSEDLLAAIAIDPSLHGYVRMRAAAMLGLFATPDSLRLSSRLAEDTALDREVRIQAAVALNFVARALRSQPGILLVARLAADDPDPVVRRALAHVLPQASPVRRRLSDRSIGNLAVEGTSKR